MRIYAYNELIRQLHPGAIILMHTVAKHNADALPDFIKEAKKQGYTFGTLDDLVMMIIWRIGNLNILWMHKSE